MNLDGHRIKKGLKVVASSNYPLHKHKFDVTKIFLPKCELNNKLEYQHIVRPLNNEQFEKAARFNILTNWWPADDVNKSNYGYMYTLCQGNWEDFHKTIINSHYC